MSDHWLIAALRERRIALGMSKMELERKANLNRATFDRREGSGRCAAIEQLERWCAALGYKLTIIPIDDEMTYWS